jgi:lipid II:glycine glycyltransferase (peptidoglycan interpeptide bridge formation enzyme)
MPIVSLSDWNQFLSAHPNAHLLQTGEWGELKSAFGWKAVRLIVGYVGIQILFRKLRLGFTIAYIPKGPVCSNPLSAISDQFWREIDLICGRNHSVFCKLELNTWDIENLSFDPYQWIYFLPGPRFPRLPFGVHIPLSIIIGSLVNHKWLTSSHNIQPPRTMIVDLSTSKEEILARMKQKTRYNIRLAEKKGVTVRAWNDIESFHKMMLLTGERDGFGVHSREYYQRAYDLLHPKQMGEIFVAEYEGKALAALFAARNGNRAYYLYGASTDEERHRMPTYLLQWEAMKWAKARGCEEYDLWGVPDEEEATLETNFEARHDGLWGVYRFKRGFGGELKRAVQAMDKVYNPLLYWAYLRFVGNRE